MANMRLEMLRRRGDADGTNSPAMRWGRLVHLAILQPDLLAALPIWTGGARRGGDWAAFAAGLGADGDHVTQAEIADLLAISNAAALAMAQLPPVVETEKEIHWQSETYGAAMAAIDAVLHGGGFLEVKTTAKIDERAFRSQCWQLGYPLQIGWYDHGARENGLTGDRIILAIESRPPYSTALWQIGPQTTRDAYHEAAAIAMRYRQCEATGRFPGPYDSEGIMALEPPQWALMDDVNMEGTENVL